MVGEAQGLSDSSSSPSWYSDCFRCGSFEMTTPCSTFAPCTASIMSAVPLGKAGVGSAVNDTTRELGGALGVAVLGSLAASHYTASLADSLGSVPNGVATAAEA